MPQDLTLTIKANDATKPGFDSASRNLDGLNRKAKETNEGFLTGLNKKAKATEETFGEERGIKKLLQGGLIGFGGEIFAGITEHAVELKKQLAEGKIGAAGVVSELLKSTPFISGFTKAGENIRELFTGEKAAIAEANEELARANSLMAVIKTNAKETRSIFESWDTTIEGSSRSLQRMLLPPSALALAENGNTLTDQLDALKKKSEEDKSKFDKQIEGLRADLAKVPNVRDPGAFPVSMAGVDANGNPVPSQDEEVIGDWKERKAAFDAAAAERNRIQREMDRANANRRTVEQKEAAAETGAYQVKFIADLKARGAGLYAQLQDLSKKYAPRMLGDKATAHANVIDEMRAYDAKQSRDAELQNILADQQIANLDKRNAMKKALLGPDNPTNAYDYVMSLASAPRSELRLPKAIEKGQVNPLAIVARERGSEEDPVVQEVRKLLRETQKTAASGVNVEKLLAEIRSMFREGFVVEN